MRPVVLIALLLMATVAQSQLTAVATYTLKQKQPVATGNSVLVMFPKPESHDANAVQTNGLEFKATVAGLYKIESAITLSGGAANTNYMLYYTKNGVIVRVQYFSFPHALNRTLNLVSDIYLKAGETVNLTMYNPGAVCYFEEYSHMIVSRYGAR